MTTFAGPFKNPADDWYVQPEGDHFIIMVGDRPHTSGNEFEDEDDAYDFIDGCRERYEEQYDRYLE